MAKLQIKDLGIGKLEKQLAELGELRITFGYQGPSGAEVHPDSDGKTIAQIAAYQEYGTPTAPARPMGSRTMEQNREAFATAGKKVISDVIDGRAEPEQAVEQAGELAVAALRKTISQSREWAEPNAASTAASKGHDQPLIGEHQTLTTHASWAARKGDSIVRQGGEE